MPRKNTEQIVAQIAEAMDEVIQSQSNPQKQLEIVLSYLKAGCLMSNLRAFRFTQQT